MALVGRIVAGLAGAWLALWVALSAIRTVVLPRSEPVVLSRAVFLAVRKAFVLRLGRSSSYEERDRVMALYAPVALVLLAFSWVVLVIVGFTGVFWATGVDPLARALELSGSSLLTLGFVAAEGVPGHLLAFVEASIGLALIALLISYLPTIYTAFQRRESLVARIAARAGDPPSAVEMIMRHHRLSRLDALDEIWDDCEQWFADIEETHTSQQSLAFFRSISHDRSWITCAGVVLDAAAFRASTLDLPREPRAEICSRAGFLALRRIARSFDIPFDHDPRAGDPISVTREEYLAAYDALVAYGVPVRPDAEQCWRDWAGWRVNYDAVLLGLCGLTMAPYARWSSDRSLRPTLPRVVRRRRTRLDGPIGPPPVSVVTLDRPDPT